MIVFKHVPYRPTLVGIAALLLLANCGGSADPAPSGGTLTPAPTPTPTPTPSPTPTPTPTPTPAPLPPLPVALFVNAAPDPGGSVSLAAAYFGASPVTGANAYRFTYVAEGAAPTVLTRATPDAFVTNLPAGAALSVTVATRDAGGTFLAESTPVLVTLPAAVTAAELARYANAAAYSEARAGEAVVILRNGAIVYQRFAAGYANTPHTLASGTKSFSCAFSAFAETDGLLSLDDKASTTITEWATDPRKSTITLRGLLSLQSGLSGNPAYSAIEAPTLDTYQLAVTDTASYREGEVFIYDPLAFQAFALIFGVRSGGSYRGNGEVSGGTDPLDYLQARLFGPLGIEANAYTWQRDIERRPQMAGGANFTATDWLKFGQFMLQKGTWQSTRLIAGERLAQCTGAYSNPAYRGYGITWWLNINSAGTVQSEDRIPSDGAPLPGFNQFAPNAPADTYLAAGTGKQRLYIIPSQNMAVVRLAPLNSGLGSDWSDDSFLGKLLGTLP